jgi:hypothetical protein
MLLAVIFSPAYSETITSTIKTLPPKTIHKIYFSLNGGYDNNASVTDEENFTPMLLLQNLNYNFTSSPNEIFEILSTIWQRHILNLNNISRFKSQAVFLNSIRRNRILTTPSYYSTSQLGDQGSYFQNEKITWYWDVNLNHKSYLTAQDYDNSQANITGGLFYYFNPKYLVDASVYYQEYLLDNQKYQETPMINLGLQRVINANNLVKIFTSDGITSYPQDSSSNLNMYQIGIQFTNTDSIQKHVLVTQITAGEYLSRDNKTPYNSSDFLGFNCNNTYNLTTKTNLNFGLTYQHMIYKGKRFPNADKEVDEYLQLSGTLSYSLTPNLIWSLTVDYTNNFSNIFTQKYNRYEIYTGIYYEF